MHQVTNGTDLSGTLRCLQRKGEPFKCYTVTITYCFEI